MKSYGTLVGELPTGIEFVVEGALLRIYFDFERREAVQKAGSEDVVVEDQYVCENVDVEGEHDYDSIVSALSWNVMMRINVMPFSPTWKWHVIWLRNLTKVSVPNI
jgi:hypothetical protein